MSSKPKSCQENVKNVLRRKLSGRCQRFPVRYSHSHPSALVPCRQHVIFTIDLGNDTRHAQLHCSDEFLTAEGHVAANKPLRAEDPEIFLPMVLGPLMVKLHACEWPLDFWTPSILILRTGDDDGEA